MAPVYSKTCSKPSPGKSSELNVLLIATQKVRPALDALISALQESASGCQVALKEVGHLLDWALESTGEAFSCCSCWCSSALLRRLTPAFAQEGAPPLLGNLPLLFVLHILVLLYNAFVFAYLPAAGLALNSPTSLVFHAMIFMVLSSFVQAVSTDPGGVPDDPKWRRHGSPPPEATEKKRGSDGARWCRTEEAYKPDRAHRCRALGRAVLRMDHHCPWIANTVGFANHKFFFLFLLYTNAACAMMNISLLELLTHMTLPALTKFLLIGSVGLSTLLLSLLGPFFLFHCWLLARNITTVEFADRSREPDKDGREPTVFATTSTYDMGIYENLCSVLGKNPLLWLLPVGGPTGDGLSFPTQHSPAIAHALLSPSVSDSEAESEPVALSGLQVGGPLLAIHEDGDLEKGWDEDMELAEEPLNGVGIMAAASELTDDFRVGCGFVGDAARDGYDIMGEAARHSLTEVASTFGDAFCRFTSLCSSSSGEHRKSKKKRSSRSSTSRPSISSQEAPVQEVASVDATAATSEAPMTQEKGVVEKLVDAIEATEAASRGRLSTGEILLL